MTPSALRYWRCALIATCCRLASSGSRGRGFRLTLFPPLPLPRSGDRHADVAALMLAVNRTLEGWIRDRPAEWLWLHRRWPD